VLRWYGNAGSDRAWDVGEHGVLVRSAGALVMCRSREQAEAALAQLRVLLVARQ
jgi:RNA-directed DNA polymerase